MSLTPQLLCKPSSVGETSECKWSIDDSALIQFFRHARADERFGQAEDVDRATNQTHTVMPRLNGGPGNLDGFALQCVPAWIPGQGENDHLGSDYLQRAIQFGAAPEPKQLFRTG